MPTSALLVQPFWAISHDAILITTFEVDPAKRTIVYANPAFTKLTGYGAAEAVGKPASICDGAKTGCSLKVSTAASAAVKAALLARNHIRVSANQGIVAETADASIQNLGKLSREGMQQTDRQIVSIMLDKLPAAKPE